MNADADVSRLKKNPLQCHYNQKNQIMSKNCDSSLAKVLILAGKPQGNFVKKILKVKRRDQNQQRH